MEKVIIVSDSHGLKDDLGVIYDYFKTETTHFLHCGDSELVASDAALEHYKSVKGNCDAYDYKVFDVITVENKTILFTHGHRYGVKMGLSKLVELGEAYNADVICFGHTHRPIVEEDGHTLFINPGSIKHNRGFFTPPPCFAVLEIDGDKIHVQHYNSKTFQKVRI